jgi:F-type H+-transporting ATPase subunit b
LISVDLSALIIVALVFSLVLVLGRLFWEPLAQAMETRQGRIEGAERIRAETAKVVADTLATHREAVSRARTEGYGSLDRARAEAHSEAHSEVGAEREKTLAEIERARDSIREQGDRALKSLEAEADRLASEIASRILGRNVA